MGFAVTALWLPILLLLTLALVCNEIWKFVVYGIGDHKEDTIDSVYSWGICILCDGIDFFHALAVVVLWELRRGLGFVCLFVCLYFFFFFFLTIGLLSYYRWCCRKNREGKRQRRWDLFLTVGSLSLPGVIYQNKNKNF